MSNHIKDVDPRAGLMKLLTQYYSGLVGRPKPMYPGTLRAGQSPLRQMGRDMAMQRAASGGPAGFNKVQGFLDHFLGGGGQSGPPQGGPIGSGGPPPGGGGGFDISSLLALLRGGGGGGGVMPPQGPPPQQGPGQDFMAQSGGDPRNQY